MLLASQSVGHQEDFLCCERASAKSMWTSDWPVHLVLSGSQHLLRFQVADNWISVKSREDVRLVAAELLHY